MRFNNNDFKIEGSVGGTIGNIIRAPGKEIKETTTSVGKGVDPIIDTTTGLFSGALEGILDVFFWPLIIFAFVVALGVLYKLYEFFKSNPVDEMREIMAMQQLQRDDYLEDDYPEEEYPEDNYPEERY